MILIPKEVDKLTEIESLKQVKSDIQNNAMEKYFIGGNIIEFENKDTIDLEDYLYEVIDAESI